MVLWVAGVGGAGRCHAMGMHHGQMMLVVSGSAAGGDRRDESWYSGVGKRNGGVRYLEEKEKIHCVRMCKVHGELI